jgi:hypothetical protein
VRKILRPRPTRPHSQNAIKRCGTRPTNTVATRHSALRLAQSPSANVHKRQSPDWRGLARCSVVVAEPLRTHFWRKGSLSRVAPVLAYRGVGRSSPALSASRATVEPLAKASAQDSPLYGGEAPLALPTHATGTPLQEPDGSCLP